MTHDVVIEAKDAVIPMCQECFAQGVANALYNDGMTVACPVHGEVSSQRMADYLERGTLFLVGDWGRGQARGLPALNNGDTS